MFPVGALSRVPVGGEREGDPSLRECAGGCLAGQAQHHAGHWQEHRDDVGSGQRGDSGVGDLLEVIGAQGADFGAELRAATRAELVGVQPQVESGALGRREGATDLRRGECALFEEGVELTAESCRAGRRNQLGDDVIHEAGAVDASGEGVQAEQRW